jgi:hypothetical protein
MAQNIILKRSSLPGKVPDTNSLNVGEVAINTYDGKLFIKRSGNTDSIQSVLTTDSVTTGSITLTQTASVAELVVTQDANIQRDLYVTNDIIGAGDIDITGDITGSSALLSGSLVVSGSTTITDNLTVLGAVNARQFNINVISSSVIYQSGSTKFGDTIDDTHEFTGSIDVSGSIVLNGIELGGSANSGSFTGSFTGSFIGDGSGLRGVVSDDLPIDGWDYQSNSSASISDFNVTSSKYIIDFEWDSQMGTPIGHKTFISNKSGSTQVVPTDSGVKFVVANSVVATIDENGITANPIAGTVSGSSQLTSSYDTRYVLSGSITQTTWDNIASKPGGIISGSSQISSLGYATTGSNTFVGTQTLSGSLIPATDNTYDLGSATYQWRDIYVSSGSLYIDGTKVLGSTNQELQITTDVGQSIKILEAGTDNIILQSADGDIQLKTSGGGNLLFDPTTGLIDVRGTFQIQDGYKVTSSGGNTIQFGNDLGITGSINTTGNINGINLTTFSSSIASTFLNQNSATSSYETKGNGIVSGSSQITLSSTTGFTTYSSSVDSRITTEKGRVDAILLASDADKDSFAEIVTLINSVDTSNDSTFASFYTGSNNRLNNLESFTSSIDTTIKTKLNVDNVVSSSSQVVGILSSLNTYTGSNDTTNTAQNTRLTTIESVTGSYETKGRGIVSGSSQIDVMSTTNIARLATTGSNQFVGNQIITGSMYMSGSLIISRGASTTSTTFASIDMINTYASPTTVAARITAETIGSGGNPWDSSNIVFSTANGFGSVTPQLRLTNVGGLQPIANGTQDLGSASLRWGTIYTSDLSLNNGIGDWTIVEGEDDLFLYNNKKGKVYKFALTEVDPNVATPKKS